ncbi:unnamed protein product [Aureobasidium vineae]|uniref:Uncharacterized protein n=1 Tax=Aureobasidium vineae TaxID=2773715 RepID=A0A9N8J9F1_9PEZI|nr:unnamed protein product [Aureobasidium vineae]
MKRRYGSVLIENTDIEWIVTVPAIWSDTAKDATLKAAQMAGLGRSSKLSLVTEPEAAAIYAFKVLEDFNLRVGDHHIICDCGGGMYARMSTNRPLKFLQHDNRGSVPFLIQEIC